MSNSHGLHTPQRVVLDSNIWLDLLVFDDPATHPIRNALEAGSITALIDDRCFNELERVFDYPQFQRRGIDAAALLATVRRLTHWVAPSAPSARALPQCKDRDDQKFLELAHATNAEWLVSKDRALLKLARRTGRDFNFHIAQPAPFVAACALVTNVRILDEAVTTATLYAAPTPSPCQ